MKKMPKILEVKKPWGRFLEYCKNEKATVKIITIAKDGMLSLQSHKNRDELWVPLDAGLTVQAGKKKFRAVVGKPVFIPRNTKHRVSASKSARFLEISFGKFDEKDIERFEDKYGRAGTTRV